MFGRSRKAEKGPDGHRHETPEQSLARLNQTIGTVSESLKDSLARLERTSPTLQAARVTPTSLPPPTGMPLRNGKAPSAPPSATVKPRNPEHFDLPAEAHQVWNVLLDGNRDWMRGRTPGKGRTPTARKAVAGDHEPLAVIMTCVDARVTPEFIFDVGVGQLVVVRSAGNVSDQLTLASAEFGLRRFGTPLVVVLAHSHCQASAMAAKAAMLEDDPFAAGFGSITSSLRPAYELVIETAHNPAHRPTADEIACAQAQRVVDMLRRGHAIGSHVDKGKVGVIPAYYDVKSGAVRELAKGQVQPTVESGH